MSMDLPEAAPPADVELDREHGLTLRWPDGFEARFGLEELRLNCPCAECRDRREQGTPVWSPAAPRPLRAVDAELVGAWGLLIRWNDGHETGIFSWGVLRNWR